MPGKILIIDDIATNRIVLKVKLSSAFYTVKQAQSGKDGLEMIEQYKPDLILISASLNDMEATDFCQILRNKPEFSTIPIVSIASECDAETRLLALAAGIDDILAKPLDDMLLLARLRSLLRSRDTTEEMRLRDVTNRALGVSTGFGTDVNAGFAEDQNTYTAPANIILVGSDRATVFRWKSTLGAQTSHSLAGVGLKGAMRKMPRNSVPDVYVVLLDKDDAELGLRLMAEIRAQSQSRYAAVIAVLKTNDRRLAADALDLGANDLMPIEYGPKELSLRINAQLKRKRLSDKLRSNLRDGLRAAVIDPLTGLYNRRYAMPHLARMSANAEKTGRKYTVMLADLDHFKKVNDTYGHAVGDTVLVAVANKLRENLRDIDMIARIGGEEFLIAMPETDRQEARVAAHRLCQIIQDMAVQIPDHKTPINVTISIGVAVNTIGPATKVLNVSALLDQADKALYGAKTEGRNQISLSARPAA